MTNENLKVGDVAEAIEFMERLDGFYDMDLSHHIAAIKSHQSRIEVLESAIREFLKCDLRCELSSFNHEPCEAENELRYIARTNLEKLMENEK